MQKEGKCIMLHKILRCGSAGVIAMLVGVVLMGCGQDSPASLENPFDTSMGYFSLKGYCSGYEPGSTYRLGLKLNNTEKETWEGKYSIYLIDTKGVVLNIVNQKQFTLSPQSSMAADFDMALPKTISKGRYGLYVVFPGRITSISTIYLGEEPASTVMPVRKGGDTPPPINLWPAPGNLPQL
jgi:hypothetical protein